ncbi:sulfotransferase domain protein [Pleomorphomonas sp. SM30]|uniref:Sulfotransferase domain-containing protein n=1 Tax=Oharaeibacter diazotrophicus TaxID=1920512 RepID=A0A4R6RLH5_9HYPH|nr:sulfotransferase domain-containing protein [Oharaeibacter diazotrophicus]BBE70545.1 sulfotransferase domain protein [Pleomorphomonas sp. SM30]GLS77292.1 sulfotransferase [Oharaeibacter diazotrophicus]
MTEARRTVAGLFWIASHPKSGNTWMRCLIDSLGRGGLPPDLEGLHHRCPAAADPHWLEAVTDVPTADLGPTELSALRLSAYRALVGGGSWARRAAPAVRHVKVHDRYDPADFPPDVTAGAVYVVRDPRAVASSWAAHSGTTAATIVARMGRPDPGRHAMPSPRKPTVPERVGSWSEHVLSWLDEFPAPRLVVRYEDLLADPLAVTGRLAGFLGLPDEPALVSAAVGACRFDALRRIEDATEFPERPPTAERFFRRGRADGWTTELTEAEAARIVADHGAVMARLGYL